MSTELEKLILKNIEESVQKNNRSSTYSKDKTRSYPSNVQYPMSEDEVLSFKFGDSLDSCIANIPESLHNRQFEINSDLRIYIQKNTKMTNAPSGYSRSSHGLQGYYYNQVNTCFVIVEYHGYYYIFGKGYDSINIRYYHCLPTQSNWSWLKFTEEKPYVKEEESVSHNFEYSESLDKMMELLLTEDVKEIPEGLGELDYYSYSYSNRKSHNNTTILNLSKEKIDLEWYIEQDTKDFEFKPSSNFVDNILDVVQKKDKNILQNMLIRKVYMRGKQYFNILDYFDIHGIEIKAPKSVIKSFGLEKYIVDDKMLREIEDEKRILEEKEAYFEKENTFTLMQHGKNVLKNKSKEDIQDYLESHTIKYPFKSVKKITEDYQITKAMKENLGVYMEDDLSDLTFDTLRDIIRYNSEYDKSTDGLYFNYLYHLETDKYIFETTGSEYIKDQLICDLEMDSVITVKQLF